MVSVLMAVYKESIQYIKESVMSIINQTYRNLEIIIVIDDPCNHQAKDFLKAVAMSDTRVKLIFNDENLGLIKSLNKGIKAVSGDYIARMDADDVCDLDRIRKELGYLLQNRCDLVGCAVDRINEDGDLVGKGHIYSGEDSMISQILKIDNFIPHPTWLVKTCVYSRLNGYREIFACEDYDFLLRASDYGYKIGLCREILLQYRINMSGISRKNSFKQLITSCYLHKHIHEIHSIDLHKLQSFVNRVYTETKAEKYESALLMYDHSLIQIKEGDIVSGIQTLLKAIMKSRFVLIKGVHLIRMRLLALAKKKA